MPALEFALDPADAAALLRIPGIRAARSFAVAVTWHDTAAGELAAAGLALSQSGAAWRLAGLRPATACTVMAPVAEGRSAAALLLSGLPLPALTGPPAPVARLVGRRQVLRWSGAAGPVTLSVLDGQMEGAGPLCRVQIEGEAAASAELARQLAEQVGLTVPRGSLAAEALAAVRGEAPAPRALGAPRVAAGQSVSDSLVTLLSHLLDALLHWVAQAATDAGPEPIHQARVATRRLRSALSVYKGAAPCPALAAIALPLRDCAARLGQVRDWDVFLEGVGARFAAAFADGAQSRDLLRAAAERRGAMHDQLRQYLAGPELRVLAATLASAAALRPWEADGADAGEEDAAVFAAGVLARRLRRVRRDGRHIDTLAIPALHELRKDCKRLRYAAEFFAPLFSAKRAKRFTAALAELQEELGLLNDGAAVSGLMAQLGRLERSHAAGLVEGFAVAESAPARGRIGRAWTRFREEKPFW